MITNYDEYILENKITDIVKKFNENKLFSIEEELELKILEIIEYEVETERVNYTDDYEITGISREKAAKEIVKYLIDNLTPEMIKEIQLKQDSKKYNL